jgi:tryptophanyl-tRNA synthetase
MSKSYDNTIPLFAPRATLRKLIMSIVTDSTEPGVRKDADASNVFQLYQAFASADETAAMRREFEAGIAWGDAKQALFERIDAEVAPLRERYEALIAKPAEIEAILRDGARRVRETHVTPFVVRLREAVGLRDLSRIAVSSPEAAKAKPALPVFKQYREADGRFYFKLVDGERVLLQSVGFDAPKDAGQRVAALKREGRFDDGDAAVRLGESIGREEVDAALAALRDAAGEAP